MNTNRLFNAVCSFSKRLLTAIYCPKSQEISRFSAFTNYTDIERFVEISNVMHNFVKRQTMFRQIIDQPNQNTQNMEKGKRRNK